MKRTKTGFAIVSVATAVIGAVGLSIWAYTSRRKPTCNKRCVNPLSSTSDHHENKTTPPAHAKIENLPTIIPAVRTHLEKAGKIEPEVKELIVDRPPDPWISDLPSCVAEAWRSYQGSSISEIRSLDICDLPLGWMFIVGSDRVTNVKLARTIGEKLADRGVDGYDQNRRKTGYRIPFRLMAYRLAGTSTDVYEGLPVHTFYEPPTPRRCFDARKDVPVPTILYTDYNMWEQLKKAHLLREHRYMYGFANVDSPPSLVDTDEIAGMFWQISLLPSDDGRYDALRKLVDNDKAFLVIIPFQEKVTQPDDIENPLVWADETGMPALPSVPIPERVQKQTSGQRTRYRFFITTLEEWQGYF